MQRALGRFFFSFFVLFCSSTLFAMSQPQKKVEFVVVIPSYNNERWCIQNVESVVNQTYPHIEIIYVNDCSKDKTYELVAAYIKEKNLQHRFTLINNPVRKGAMQNIYETIQKIAPHKVVAV